MEFASYGQIFNAFGEKKDFPKGRIPTPKASYSNRPEGTASINN
jgi:hypothetical protein